MTGQMTYTKKTKSWRYIPLNKMTMLSARKNNTIQSREDYYTKEIHYMAWTNHLVNGGNLEDMIK